MTSPPTENEGRKRRVRLVLLLSLGIYGVIMLALGTAWYSSQWTSSFHLFNDWPEWQQMDKVAHFFWTFHTCALAARLLRWATLGEKEAAWLGALFGFFLVSGIEVFDGFSVAYGASLYDIVANGVGALAFAGQSIFWKRILVWPKFSFHPTTFAPLRPELLGDGFLEQVLKDYNGQTFWYSGHVPWLRLPRWLNLAVGIGAEGMIFGRAFQNEAVQLHPERKYFLSFDLNFSHVKTSSKALGTLLYVVNIIKVPAPTLEVSSRGLRFHWLYF